MYLAHKKWCKWYINNDSFKNSFANHLTHELK